MHVITRKHLLEFAQRHPDCRSALDNWYRLVKRAVFTSFDDVRKTFPNADRVGKHTVFNIGGNKVRLITAVQYNRKKIYILYVLTHDEYNKERWKE
jgi:mRNA interferase HigB